MGLTRPHWHWSHKCTPAADVRRWTTPPLPPTPCRVRVTGPSPPLPPLPAPPGQLRCQVIPWGGRFAWLVALPPFSGRRLRLLGRVPGPRGCLQRCSMRPPSAL